MGWLNRLLGGATPAAAASDEASEDAIRAGFDLECRGDHEGAARCYARALELNAQCSEAEFYLGRLALADRREDEAISCLQRAAERAPREATYLGLLGDALVEARRYAEVVEVFDAARKLLPECAAFRNNYAVGLIETQRRDEALAELELLRDELPEVAQLHFNLGGIYHEYGRTEEAIAAYRRCLALTPRHAQTFDNLLLELNYSAAHGADQVFEDHRRYGERFARAYAAPQPDPAWPRRLRVGYVSPDFRAHSVAYFIEPILARHDRSQFEVYCYHVHRRKDATTERLKQLADHWRDGEELSDEALAAQIAADRIDLLIDLAGHTSDNRLQAFALKPAPVQAIYLGYPNTSGLGAMDWHLTDARADPPASAARHNVERVAHLPVSYFCYRPPPAYPEVAPMPAGQARPITFGSFNHFPKLSAPYLDAVARILEATPGSRLLLKSRPLSNPNLARRVRERFDAARIAPERIELRGWEPEVKDHLGIYGSVDLALDSFPYNGATTTCEALWMGVPVVTLAGDRHAGRMGASLLHAVGLPELVTGSVEQYIAASAALAGDRGRLRELRAGMRERMRRSPLMDEVGFTRDLEACYLDMWRQRERPAAASSSPGLPGHGVDDLLARARRLKDQRKPAQAQVLCREAIEREPMHAGALEMFWNLAFDLEVPGAAVAPLSRAIEMRGEVAFFHHMLGSALQAQGLHDDAVASFRRALALDGSLARTHNNLGCLLEAAGDLEGALAAYRSAIREEPKLAQAHYNLGNACRQAGDADAARKHIAAALALDPAQPEWRCNLGDLQFGRLHLDEAVASFSEALATDPAYARAYANLGLALAVLGRAGEADEAFAAALRLRPDAQDESWRLLLAHYQDDEEGSAPEALYQRHLAWAHRYERPLPRVTLHPGRPRTGERRLNVGYLSPHFFEHPIAALLEPVFAAHDREAVRLFAYSNAAHADAGTQRLRQHFAHWRDIAGLPDADVAERIRADGIDILVDLAGHAAGGRLAVFARKPAPVQVSWLGYPDTTGLASMDYRITDAIADPQGAADARHSERLIRLPGFFCYAPPAGAPQVPPVASVAAGAGAIRFACIEGLARITPGTIALWAKLLQQVPESRLLLRDFGLAAPSARRALREAFLAQGIADSRLALESLAPDTDPLAAWRGADIALDTLPCNALATTCDALWMGVPLVTLAGATHASRMGASILARAGLDELVARTPEEFVAIAARLAQDAPRLASLRLGLRKRLEASPLCDVQGFTRALEGAYREIWPRA